VNNNNVESWQEATSRIEQATGLQAGSPVAWESAEPGHYAVFTGDGAHVVYGYVPRPTPNLSAYLYDAQTGDVLQGTASAYQGRNVIAVPFTKKLTYP